MIIFIYKIIIKNNKMLVSDLNIVDMPINKLIDFIRDKLYLDNNNQIISQCCVFKGNKIEFDNFGNDYINMLRNKFNHCNVISENQIIIYYNNIQFDITILANNSWSIDIT